MNLFQIIRFRTRRHLPMGKFALLLFVLLCIIVTFPFLEDYPSLNKVVVVIGLSTVLAALWAVSDSRVAFVLTALLAVPTVIANLLNSVSDSDQYAYFAIPLAFAFYMLLNMKILRSVIKAETVDWDILCGAISVYLLLGMNWTLIYTFLDLLNPNSFSIHAAFRDDGVIGNTDFFFFSFVTLTTLGYGDIVPTAVPARVFAVLEAVAGQLYVAVIIGKIISVSPLRNVLPAPGSFVFHRGGRHSDAPSVTAVVDGSAVTATAPSTGSAADPVIDPTGAISVSVAVAGEVAAAEVAGAAAEAAASGNDDGTGSSDNGNDDSSDHSSDDSSSGDGRGSRNS